MRDYTALHQQWLEKYHDQINSGKSITFWCKENNIKYESFCYRLRRLQQLGLIALSTNSSAFVEIKAPITTSSAIATACSIVLPNETTISITNEISKSVFSILLAKITKSKTRKQQSQY